MVPCVVRLPGGARAARLRMPQEMQSHAILFLSTEDEAVAKKNQTAGKSIFADVVVDECHISNCVKKTVGKSSGPAAINIVTIRVCLRGRV